MKTIFDYEYGLLLLQLEEMITPMVLKVGNIPTVDKQ